MGGTVIAPVLCVTENDYGNMTPEVFVFFTESIGNVPP